MSLGRSDLSPRQAARVVVCEQHGSWTAALRRALEGHGRGTPQPTPQETRNVDQWLQVLGDAPASFLALEVTLQNLEQTVAQLQNLGRRFPRARAAALVTPEIAACTTLLREAGAVTVVDSPRRLQPVARLIQRHLAGTRTVPGDSHQHIWDALPWPNVANRDGVSITSTPRSGGP